MRRTGKKNVRCNEGEVSSGELEFGGQFGWKAGSLEWRLPLWHL